MELWKNSFQIFESKGPFCKIFRNKDLGGSSPPKILWGSFEARRLSTDTLRNCPNKLLLSQWSELEVNNYRGGMACEGRRVSQFGNGVVCQSHCWEIVMKGLYGANLGDTHVYSLRLCLP